jgi:hypothetical protein
MPNDQIGTRAQKGIDCVVVLSKDAVTPMGGGNDCPKHFVGAS